VRPTPSLQQSLLALVAVPVIGLAGAAGLVVDQRHDVARASETAAAQVRAAVLLDAVRAGVTQEVVPVLGEAVLEDPTTAASVGVDVSGIAALAGPAISAQLRSVQAATDAAVAGTRGSVAAGEAQAAAVRVARLRAAATGDVTAVFTQYQELVADLSRQVDSHLDAARDQSLDGAGAQAVDDLSIAQLGSTSASLEVPLYLGSLSVAADDRAAARSSFLQAWGGYRAADADITHQSGALARRAWVAATGTPAARQVDATVDAGALTGSAVSLPQFLALTTANTSRDAAVRRAVETIGADAVRVTAQPARRADAQLRQFLVLGAALLLLTLGVTVAVHRFIARPLRRLAAAAGSVRDGELLDVGEGGPREVRTVARGLEAAVASLRRVRAQAQAVADGDITSSVVREPLAGPLGAVVHASITQMIGAIHERERLQASLAHQASHDALTDLPNRAQALVLIRGALHRAQRSGQPLGLLFVDLDHFKQVNDSLGHAAGDEVLRTVSRRMQATVRGGDAVCRLGGDEFVVLVEAARDHHELVELGQRLIADVSAPVALGERTARVGASVGITVSDPRGGDCPDTTPDRLLQEADAAAYHAKDSGRGVVEVFDEELRRDLNLQAETEDALRQALARDELVLHYQPVLDLTTGETRGVEALVRWNRPGHGLVPPDSFIPLAERTDLICDIGRWTLGRALSQLAAWDAEGGGLAGLGVAVNVSGRQLAARQLLEDVAEALADAAVAPARLTLEITETVLVDQPTALAQMVALRGLGVRIAIDDFGTGYTSIGQLPRLPVDVLKIDRSFVSSPGEGHAELVRLVISAAHSFDIDVVAEGVEEDGQLQSLIAASCDRGQGFLFARPVAADDLALPTAHPEPVPSVPRQAVAHTA